MEVESYFNRSKSEVKRIISKLGLIGLYQQSKLNGEGKSEWLKFRKVMDNNLYLWSDSVGFYDIASGISEQKLGLAILSLIDYRHATIWSLRIKTPIENGVVKVKSHERLRFLMGFLTTN